VEAKLVPNSKLVDVTPAFGSATVEADARSNFVIGHCPLSETLCGCLGDCAVPMATDCVDGNGGVEEAVELRTWRHTRVDTDTSVAQVCDTQSRHISDAWTVRAANVDGAAAASFPCGCQGEQARGSSSSSSPAAALTLGRGPASEASAGVEATACSVPTEEQKLRSAVDAELDRALVLLDTGRTSACRAAEGARLEVGDRALAIGQHRPLLEEEASTQVGGGDRCEPLEEDEWRVMVDAELERGLIRLNNVQRTSRLSLEKSRIEAARWALAGPVRRREASRGRTEVPVSGAVEEVSKPTPQETSSTNRPLATTSSTSTPALPATAVPTPAAMPLVGCGLSVAAGALPPPLPRPDEDESRQGQCRRGGIEVVVDSPDAARGRMERMQARLRRQERAQSARSARQRRPSPRHSCPPLDTGAAVPAAQVARPSRSRPPPSADSCCSAIGGDAREPGGEAGVSGSRPQSVGRRICVSAPSSAQRQPPPVRSASAGPAPGNRGDGRRMQSNRRLIRNALGSYCLKGDANREQREQVLRAFDDDLCGYERFVILFRSIHTGRHDLRALYGYQNGCWVKVLQALPSPPQLEEHMVAHFLRYDSAGKEFREVPSLQEMGIADAVFLHQQHLQKCRVVAK